MYKGLRARARISVVVAIAAMTVLPGTALAAHFGERTLSTGSTGHDVKVLQSWLNKMGLRTGIDGQFGRNTRWNLRRFEQAKGLPVNGVLTPSDAQVMRRAMAAHYSYVQEDPPDDQPTKEVAPGAKATMSSDGLHAVAPSDAPPEVQSAIAAANKIVGKPYKYGGGHGNWEDSGYDCSGTVSYALHGAGLLDDAMPSGNFTSWGEAGPGQWVTIYANGGHIYMVVAGLRFDTSGRSNHNTRWQTEQRSGAGYTVRHPPGL
jgi:peptidoglycan hydrolase-like protein with peptidoglycan-binding domain